MDHYQSVTQDVRRLNQNPGLKLIGLRQKVMTWSQSNE
jgi:hypothetical protein